MLAQTDLINEDDTGPVKLEDVANACPTATTIKNIANKAKIDLEILTEHQILSEQTAVYISADKAESKAKQEKSQGSHFIKMLSHFSHEEGKVLVRLLDADGSGGSSKKCGKAAEFSLERIFEGEKHRHCLFGQCTDSGGGGTLGSFEEELKGAMLCVLVGYIVIACTLHCLQLCFSKPILEILGDGGIEMHENKRTAMQCFLAVYNLQNVWCPSLCVWEYFVKKEKAQIGSNDDVKDITKVLQKPVLTRWWTVGVAAMRIICHRKISIKICELIIKQHGSSDGFGKCASGVYSVLKEDMIYGDICLITAFHDYFMSMHFSWLQKGAPDIVGTPGYLSRHIPIRYFIMYHYLSSGLSGKWVNDGKGGKTHEGGWKNIDSFDFFWSKCKETIGKCDKTVAVGGEKIPFLQFEEQKVESFFQLAFKQLVKHFKTWANEKLFFALFSESPTAKCVARLLN